MNPIFEHNAVYRENFSDEELEAWCEKWNELNNLFGETQ